MLTQVTGIPCHVAENALNSVAVGTGLALEQEGVDLAFRISTGHAIRSWDDGLARASASRLARSARVA